MNYFYVLILVLSTYLAPDDAVADLNLPEVAKQHIQKPKLVGETRMRFFFWDIYDVALYSETGKHSFEVPFLMTFNYLRDLDGEDIADRSVAEIIRLGFSNETKLKAWTLKLRDIFPNVKKGTRLIGTYTPEGDTIFYDNNGEIGRVEDNEFGRWFYGIWLAKNTSVPDVRQKLLGENE